MKGQSACAGWVLLGCILLVSTGCANFLATRQVPPLPEPHAPESDVPRELAKVSLPPYIIEPPDILLIDAVKIIPRGPHQIETFDVLAIRVEGALTEQPILGTYLVDTEGLLDLGPAYGRVRVVDLTIDEARAAIQRHLEQILQQPEVAVSLAASAGAQRISGEHLVGPDGTVNLGTYGAVHVAGLTLAEAKQAIETHLAQHLEEPEISVDVFAYNSKVFYVITEGAGFGDNVTRIPVTGNETVLDAIASIGGLSQLSSKKLWISRPAPNEIGCEQILPVDWQSITRGATTATNYQLLPGDRLFIAEDHLIAFDSVVAKVTRPFERIFGFNLLGTQMIERFNTLPRGRNFIR